MSTLYYSRLDTLRFIAFFLVFWQHGFAPVFDSISFLDSETVKSFTMTGGHGVHIFFVLSGFLITLLLLKEYQFNGFISIKNFYIRRTLRIWPLYYLMMITGVYILPNLFNTIQFCGSPIYSLTFLNNFDVHPECTTSVGMAWSVAIEEQFYLVWPLIFMLLIRKPVILIIFCFLLLILSLCYNYGYPISSYFHTFGNIIYLMTGCLGAILFVKKNEFITKKKWMNKGTFFLSLILIFVIVAMRISFAEFILPVIYIYIVIYLVVMEDHSKRINVFSRLGKYTFGMYMYHPTLILLFKIAFDKLGYDYHENKGAHALMAILVLVSTIAISWVSYEFFEKKILQFKSQFASIKTRV
ncbi:MAG: hypothetical protein RI883_1850 [Bacteroidota bacterium]